MQGVAHFALNLHFADGPNVYGYLQHSPLKGRDPLGLWMWGDWSDTLAKGAEVGALAQAAIDTYQFLMEEASDWALDWSRPDEEWNDFVAIAASVSDSVDHEVDEVAEAYAPLLAGTKVFKVGKAVAKGRKVTDAAKALFEKWLNRGHKNVSVYIGARNGRPYVGITNNVISRSRQHGVQINPIASGLTRNQARAIENKIISANPRFDNVIQSISEKHRFAIWADEWAGTFMRKSGIAAKW
jgi:hypothetical protein